MDANANFSLLFASSPSSAGHSGGGTTVGIQFGFVFATRTNGTTPVLFITTPQRIAGAVDTGTKIHLLPFPLDLARRRCRFTATRNLVKGVSTTTFGFVGNACCVCRSCRWLGRSGKQGWSQRGAISSRMMSRRSNGRTSRWRIGWRDCGRVGGNSCR